MFIPTKITEKLGVSLIKKNNKISICLAKNVDGKVEPLLETDKEFPFNNPLVSGNSVKIFEFIIEANNFVKRLDIKGNIDEIYKPCCSICDDEGESE